MSSSKPWLFVGAAGGLAAVALGAFGAHVLKPRLSERLFEAFSTAVEYQMYHSLLLLLLGLLMILYPAIRQFRIAAGLVLLGVLLFSGSLYGLVLMGNRLIAMATPVGGVILMSGWVLLLFGCARIPGTSSTDHNPVSRVGFDE